MEEDERKRAWPKLYVGDMVRGQDPKTKEWSLKEEVFEMVNGDKLAILRTEGPACLRGRR